MLRFPTFLIGPYKLLHLEEYSHCQFSTGTQVRYSLHLHSRCVVQSYHSWISPRKTFGCFSMYGGIM